MTSAAAHKASGKRPGRITETLYFVVMLLFFTASFQGGKNFVGSICKYGNIHFHFYSLTEIIETKN
jgi:hypothetical protein